jgi:hypothetical protein
MESFTEKNGGFGTNRLIQEQIGAEFSRNDTNIAPAAIGSEENLKASICDLEPHINQEEKEIVRDKAMTLKEIERVESEFNTTGIPLQEKKEIARASNRRRKIRVYIP